MASISAEQIKILSSAQSVVDTVTQPRAATQKRGPQDSFELNSIPLIFKTTLGLMLECAESPSKWIVPTIITAKLVSHVRTGSNLDKLPADWQPECKQIYQSERDNIGTAIVGFGAFGFGVSHMQHGVKTFSESNFDSMTLHDSIKAVFSSGFEMLVGTAVGAAGAHYAIKGMFGTANAGYQYRSKCTEFGRKRVAEEAAEKTASAKGHPGIEDNRSIVDTSVLPELKPWQQIVILGVAMAGYLETLSIPSTSSFSSSLSSGLVTSSRHPSLFSSSEDGSI